MMPASDTLTAQEGASPCPGRSEYSCRLSHSSAYNVIIFLHKIEALKKEWLSIQNDKWDNFN